MSNCCNEPSESCNRDNSINQLSTKLTGSDVLGTWKARWGIDRMNYKVNPGLYKIGKPSSESPVLVTGNYKMSVDCLRKALKNIDAWILVLDTKGINVWCAAGKGTFGTEELINRINIVNLSQFVKHKNIIIPQLGAVGVAAHEVKKATGFHVTFGPVRAEDIPKFLMNGLKAEEEMRKVRFNVVDRAVLTPMELVGAVKPTLLTLGILFLSNVMGITKISSKDVKAYVGAVLVGTVLVPIMLPTIPARSFSMKGWILGLIWSLCVSKKNGLLKGTNKDLLKVAQYLLVLPSVSAVHAFNFTGSSTYTSMSGVQKETKIAMPLIGVSVLAGVLLMIKSNFSK